VGKLATPVLTREQTEGLCTTAVSATKEYPLPKDHAKSIETLSVCGEGDDANTVTPDVKVGLNLSTSVTNMSAQALVDGTTEEDFKSADKHLKELACRSQR
jgi:hypothetical protein